MSLVLINIQSTKQIYQTRVSCEPPFTFTSFDYAGPYVQNIYEGSKTCKVWIFLFTCPSTRDICLELVPSYNASAWIRGLTQFFSRRGTPSSILSDNGSYFGFYQNHLPPTID